MPVQWSVWSNGDRNFVVISAFCNLALDIFPSLSLTISHDVCYERDEVPRYIFVQNIKC